MNQIREHQEHTEIQTPTLEEEIEQTEHITEEKPKKTEKKPPKPQTYYIYILECKDKTLYTGITNNMKSRLKKHHDGTGAKYTRGRGPFNLLYLATTENRSLASIEESRIKKLTKQEKFHLIQNADKTILNQIKRTLHQHRPE